MSEKTFDLFLARCNDKSDKLSLIMALINYPSVKIVSIL